MSHASALVTLGIPTIAALVIALFLAGVRRAAPERLARVGVATVAWVAVGGGLAAAGVLARFDLRPPPLMLLMAATVGLALVVGLSPLGRALAEHVPLWALVGFQAFRLPLELVMHRAASEGVMPVEMSYSGYNFDIVSGASALVVAWALRRGASRRLALAWNVLGLALLLAIATIAIAATPVFQAFGPDSLNVFVTHFPFVYLPQVLVFAALAGHVVVFRALGTPLS